VRDDQARRRAISAQLEAMDDHRMRMFLGWLASYRPEVLEEPLADFLAGGASTKPGGTPASPGEQDGPSSAAEALAEGEIGQ
jgi:hypothetical protein